MDTSYYKCLLRKMNLFQPKNKLGCASGAGSGRKRGERGGGRWESAKEKGSMKRKTPAEPNRNRRDRKGLGNDRTSKIQRNTGKTAIFRSDCTDLHFETSALCTKNM